MKKYFTLLQKNLLYYRKLYFTTENFTSLQKTLLHEKFIEDQNSLWQILLM